MSTTQTPAALVTPTHTDIAAHEVTLPRVIRSEWIKLRSVRSTVVTLGLTGVAVAVFGVLISMLSDGATVFGDGKVVYDPAGNSLFGTNLAQLVLGVLGALLITSEYATGMIRTTFAAVPKRLPVLWAKVVVVAGVAFATMVAGVAVAFFAGQALYDGNGVGASLSDPDVLRALLGAALFPAAIAVMGIALGALMRHTATAVGVLFGLLFIVPVLLQALGGVWTDVASYLPSEAGEAMTIVIDDPQRMSPLAGFVVMVGWVGALLATAAIVLKRRDV
jgi:ABC-type transport system involved in multi-copper enzyme maturation permease subunit